MWMFSVHVGRLTRAGQGYEMPLFVAINRDMNDRRPEASPPTLCLSPSMPPSHHASSHLSPTLRILSKRRLLVSPLSPIMRARRPLRPGSRRVPTRPVGRRRSSRIDIVIPGRALGTSWVLVDAGPAGGPVTAEDGPLTFLEGYRPEPRGPAGGTVGDCVEGPFIGTLV